MHSSYQIWPINGPDLIGKSYWWWKSVDIDTYYITLAMTTGGVN